MDRNTCLICLKRPRGYGSPYCTPCWAELTSERDEKTALARWWDGAEYVLIYKSQVIALMPVEDKLRPIYKGFQSLTGVPRGIILNLDHFCPGLSRQEAKRFKGCFQPFVAA